MARFSTQAKSPDGGAGALQGILWLAQRASAVLLAFGLGLHLAAIHLLPGAGYSFREVATRLASPGWRLFEALFLVAVTYHGLAGLWTIAEDYVESPKVRRLLAVLLLASGAGLVLAGICTLASVPGAG